MTNVPFDLIAALSNQLETGLPICVSIDAEGYDYIIVFDSFETFVIVSKDQHELYCFEKKSEDLAKELYEDISSNLYDWSLWDYNIETDTERVENQKKIKGELSKLKKILESKK